LPLFVRNEESAESFCSLFSYSFRCSGNAISIRTV
jgi:hypothetical protein